MGTLQSELSKIKTLGDMPYDDDENAVVVDEQPEGDDHDAGSSKRERVWTYIRNHPASNTHDIATALEMNQNEVYRCVHAMVNKKWLSKTTITGVHHYSVSVDSYPKLDRKAIMAMAREKRQKLAKAIRENKPIVITDAAGKVRYTRIAQAESAPAPVAAPPAPPTHGLDVHNVGGWPLSTARLVYTELKRYFHESHNA